MAMQKNPNQIFYSILKRVGGDGVYQITSLAFLSTIIMVAGSTSFFNAYLYYQNEYQCPFAQVDCHKYVCSISEDERSLYVKTDLKTFVSKFGDFRCEGEESLDLAQSFIYSGGIVGVILGALLSSSLTKKRILVFTVFANLFGVTITIFGPTLFISAIGLFINFASKSIQIEVIAVFISETVSQELRGKHYMIACIFFAVGVTLNGLVFKLIPQWELVLVIYIMLPLLFGLIGLLLYVEASPIDLITKHTPEQALQALKRIALKNNKENEHNLTLEELRNIREQYEQNERQKHNYSISITDLFRYDSLRKNSILVILIHFLVYFQFTVPQLALKDYKLDIYLNGIIMGLSELLAAIAGYLIVSQYERKKVIYLTEAISFCVAAILFISFTCEKSMDCQLSKFIIQSIGIFIYRFAITIAYNFFYMIQTQLFPSQIRNVAFQTSAIAKNIGIVIVPQIMYICQQLNISIILTFALTCILIAVSMVKLPETYGISPPEMVEQLKFNINDAYQPQQEGEISH